MRGSIQQRKGKSGISYSPRLRIPDPTTGEQKEIRLPVQRTKKAAQQALTQALHELDRGTYIEASDLTVAEFLKEWLQSIGASKASSTVFTYEYIVRKHLVPTLGGIGLSKLKPLDIQRCYQRFRDQGAAASTVGTRHTVLHSALEQAVRWEMLPRNPADGVKVPTATARSYKTWTAEECGEFLAAATDDERAPLWHLALETGMRLGELLGLKWTDLDSENAVLAVQRTLTRTAKGQWVVGEQTKSRRGRRSLTISRDCVAILHAHRKRQLERRVALGPEWNDLGLIFDRGDGRACSPATTQTALKRGIGRAGVSVIRFHDLRHTYATLALINGVHPKVVQERLGHSSIAMTLDLYSHVIPSLHREATDLLADLLVAARDQAVTKSLRAS